MALLFLCIYQLELKAIHASDIAVAMPPVIAVATLLNRSYFAKPCDRYLKQVKQKNKPACLSTADPAYKPKAYDPIVFLAKHEKPIAWAMGLLYLAQLIRQ